MATDVVIAVGTRGVSAAARSITRLEDRSSKFGKALATTVVGGAIVATAAVAKFAAASVKAASDSQQSIGATETVYGKYAKTVIRESNRAADALGLSANEYRELANVSGAMLKSAGVPLREVTGLTAKLEGRAADVAATFGGSTREAVEAFNAVLRGETDPVERYGVSIKQVDVNARLAAKGQDKLTGAAAKQAGAMARLDLLFGQTQSSAGQFARESDTLAGAQQRLDAKIENVQARFGKLLLPALTEGVNLVSRKVIPALDDFAGWLETNQDEIERTGSAIANGLLPPLKTLGGIAAAAAKFVAGLPPEVQSLAAQAALAALVLPRLSAALDAIQLREFVSGITDAETRTAKLAAVTRQAAGIGGVLALSQGVQQANREIGVLETTAGGAAVGFSVGGPWGAAIGAAGGAVVGLASHTDKAVQSLEAMRRQAEGGRGAQLQLRDALDQTTGAMTRQARQTVSQDVYNQHLSQSLSTLGVSNRDLVSAVLGQEGAYRRVIAAVERFQNVGGATASAQQNALSDAAVNIGAYLEGANAKFRSTRNEIREVARGTENWDKALRGLPRGIRVALRNENYRVTVAEVRALARQYDRNPKRLTTRLELAGVNVVQKGARDTKKALQDVGRAKPDTAPWLNGLEAALTGGRQRAGRGAEGIAKELRGKTAKARADLAGFNTSLNQGIATSKQWASSGGRQTGNALGQGLYSGVDVWGAPIASRAAAIVRAAVAAARRAADAHSPSQETMRLGDDMGAGLAIGLERSMPRVQAASFGIVRSIVEGLSGTDSSTPVDGAISDVVNRIQDLYGKRLDQATGAIGRRFDQVGKQIDARFAAQQKKIRKRLKGDAEDAAIRRNENKQQAADRALTKAQQQAENKLTDQNTAARKRALAIVSKYTPLLRANALAQALVNTQLEDARTALAALQEQRAGYIAQVRDNVVSFGSIIGLGEGDGFGSVDQMLGKLRAKVAQAREYANLIKSLEAAGLNDTTIEQLLAAGVEGGLGTAQAIASGGAAAIREINQLTNQLTDVGTDLGTTMADNLGSEFNAAGMAGAQGLVDGLASQQATVVAEGNRLAAALDAELARATALTAAKNHGAGKNIGKNLVGGLLEGLADNQAAVDKAARRLGNALTRAVKDELGIRSPSTVFAGIGDNVIKGLDIGLDDTHVRRTGAQLADALEGGFGAPRFEAMVGAAPSSSAAVPVQVIVQVPPTADKAAIGREVASALKAYVGVGGKVVTG